MSANKRAMLTVRDGCILLIALWVYVCLSKSVPEKLINDGFFAVLSLFAFLAMVLAGILNLISIWED